MTTPAHEKLPPHKCPYWNDDCPKCCTNPAHEWREVSFEKYLEQVCFEANPTVLDDDMPDFFDDWLGNQNGEDYIRLADEYAKHLLDTQRYNLIKEIDDSRDQDSCECDNCHRWRKFSRKILLKK